jgi:xylan 1,4-beta-xylosidase
MREMKHIIKKRCDRISKILEIFFKKRKIYLMYFYDLYYEAQIIMLRLMNRHLLFTLILVACQGWHPVFAQNKQKNKAATPERSIYLDFSREKGHLNTMFSECIGAGRANEGLRADWQQQLAWVKKECGFRYIRMHGLLTDDMGVYKEDNNGNPQYNYMYVDVLFDFLQSIGIKPFVELGFMPSALASGSTTIFWWRGNVTPPKDYEKWEGLVRNLTQHFTERYGVDEVKTWYFEVWNEPNLSPGFWTGTQEDYFRLYEYSAKAVKSVNPEYHIGGPATAGAAWEPELIDFCVNNDVPIDFISTHTYGVNQGYLDEYGNTGTILAPQEFAVSGDVLRSREEISLSAMPDLELHYTEWSSSYTPSDPIHDSYHEAAYILQKIKQVGTAANSMSYWVFTDIFEESSPRFEPFHGGFGLLTIQGINKPAFYAYQFLNRLGNIELANNDSASWVCKDSHGDIQVLAWDYTYTRPLDSINNQDYYNRDLPSRPKGKVKVTISKVPEGIYALEVYKVGYRCNDAYSSYLSLGKPAQLDKLQVEQIKRQNDGAPVSKEIITLKSGIPFSKELDLRENDVYLLALTKL